MKKGSTNSSSTRCLPMLQQTTTLSNHQIFHPHNTGSPRQDLYSHLSRLPYTARIDLEEHTIIGGNLIIRIEPDLGSAAEQEAEAKIVSVPYAEHVFGNNTDAVEFVRCVNLIAGRDARAFNLQRIASHYYGEVKTRPASEVLKEMALLALQLAAVVATEEERQFGDITETTIEVQEAELSLSDRRALFLARAAQVLGETEDETSVFELECRAISRFTSHASGFVTDEFAAYLSEREAAVENMEELDAIYESYEAAYEQYDEDHVVSLHMTDGERVVAAGSLDDDVDEGSLPEEARHLAADLYSLYANGFPLRDCGEVPGVEGVALTSYQRDAKTGERFEMPVTVYGLDTWLDAAVDAIYHERTLRTVRNLVCVPMPTRPRRTVYFEAIIPRVGTREIIRQGAKTVVKEVRHIMCRVAASVGQSRLHEQTGAIEVCPDAAEREETRRVLEILLERLKSNCHTRGLHTSATYRDLVARTDVETDTARIAALKKEAWQHKERGQLSIKLFTALMARAEARQATLEGKPLLVERTHRMLKGEGFVMTQTFSDGARKFIVVQPLINLIPSLTGKSLGAFAVALGNLPRQEKERVRAAFRTHNPHLYGRVRDGLRDELLKASEKKLRYFRWALYPGNKPAHPVHTLTRDDQATAWELLKILSRRDTAKAGPAPLLAIAEAGEKEAAAMAQIA
jgi:hypothetical protein